MARAKMSAPDEPGHGSEAGSRNVVDPPTATDVAKIAGVSRQTVANVLNAPQRVRPETRRHVERVIVELGYRPNRAAQALKLNTSRTIGYRIEPVAPGALASIHDRFLHALAEAGREADRQILVYTAADAAGEIAAAHRLHRSGSTDAFVLYDVAADNRDDLVAPDDTRDRARHIACCHASSLAGAISPRPPTSGTIS